MRAATRAELPHAPGARSRRAAVALACGLLAAGVYLALVGSPLPADSRRHLSADAQALIGHAVLFAQGELSGRDFDAAYGVVPQALSRLGLALRAGGETSGAFPLIAFVLRASAVAALVVWTGALKLPGSLARGALFALGLAAGFASSFAVLRPALALLALLAVARALEAGRGSPLRGAVPAGMALAALALVSFDFLVFGVGAALAAGLLLAVPGPWRDRSEPPARPFLRLAGLLVGILTGGVALLLAARATAVDAAQGVLAPLARSVELAATYPLTFGLPWPATPFESSIWLALALAAPIAALAAAARSSAPRRADLLVLACFAPLALKGATTRSDAGHILLGLLPSLLLLGLVALDRSLGARARAAAAALVIAALLVWPRAPASALAQDVETWNAAAAFDALRRRAPAPDLHPGELIRAARERTGPVFVFPLQIGFAALAGRPLAAPVDQAYGAHTPAMQRRVVDRLERAGSALEVFYGIDGERTWAVDNVQSIARSPVLFDFLWSRFERAPARLLDGGFLLLRRRDVARVPQWRPQRFSASGGPGVLRLDLDDPDPCPVVRLELGLDHPSWRRLGWPAGIRVRGFEQGRVALRSRLVPLDLDAPFVTYLSPLRADAFGGLFDAGPPPDAPRLDRLDFVAEDGGWFGAAPSAIRVEAVGCLG